MIDGIMSSTGSSVDLDAGNRWSAFKHLHKVITGSLCGGDAADRSELESVLRKHKADFLSLLKNPVCDT